MTATQHVPEGETKWVKEVVRVENIDPRWLNRANRWTQCQRHGCEATARFIVRFEGFGLFRCPDHTDGYIFNRNGTRIMAFTMTTVPPDVDAHSQKYR